MKYTTKNKEITNYNLEYPCNLDFLKGCVNGLLIVIPFWIAVIIVCYLLII
ncbi:hypothetical protein [Bacillus pseudomycoides]|uniref:hypothetical protein n=1 Tax=Bacillus pseudomycoides TaxID=64104 RepID=UPI001596B9D5